MKVSLPHFCVSLYIDLDTWRYMNKKNFFSENHLKDVLQQPLDVHVEKREIFIVTIIIILTTTINITFHWVFFKKIIVLPQPYSPFSYLILSVPM